MNLENEHADELNKVIVKYADVDFTKVKTANVVEFRGLVQECDKLISQMNIVRIGADARLRIIITTMLLSIVLHLVFGMTLKNVILTTTAVQIVFLLLERFALWGGKTAFKAKLNELEEYRKTLGRS